MMFSNKQNSLIFFCSNERPIIQPPRKRFNDRGSPSDKMIQKLIVRFGRSGSVDDLPGRSPPRTVRTDAVVKAVRQIFLEDPSTCTHRRSDQAGITRTILEMDLKMFPSK